MTLTAAVIIVLRQRIRTELFLSISEDLSVGFLYILPENLYCHSTFVFHGTVFLIAHKMQKYSTRDKSRYPGSPYKCLVGHQMSMKYISGRGPEVFRKTYSPSAPSLARPGMGDD